MPAMTTHNEDSQESLEEFGSQPDGGAHVDEWVTPDTADDIGYLRTGKLLEWMHVVAVLAASRHCHAPVATASMAGMHIKRPLRVGDRVSLSARVVHTSTHSLSVLVDVTVDRQHMLSGSLIFVRLDREGNLQPIPPVVPRTASEIRLYGEAELRRLERKRMQSRRRFDPPTLKLPGAPQPPANMQANLRANLPEMHAAPGRPSLATPMSTPLPTPGAPPRIGSPRRKDSGRSGSGSQRQTAQTVEWLKHLPPTLPLPWDSAIASRNRSYVHLIEPVRKAHLNFLGSLHAGTAARWLECAACLSARAWLGHAPARLSALQGLTFLRPAIERQFVHIRAMVVHTDAEVLTVLVAVYAEDPERNEQYEAVRALLNYVPTMPMPIASLPCTTESEVRLFEEAEKRVALHRALAE